jgi:hypothetical protein
MAVPTVEGYVVLASALMNTASGVWSNTESSFTPNVFMQPHVSTRGTLLAAITSEGDGWPFSFLAISPLRARHQSHEM